MFARMFACLLLGLLSFAFLLPAPAVHARERAPLVQDDIRHAQLPVEARETLHRIRTGARLPYAKDGTVFGNREGMLPDVVDKLTPSGQIPDGGLGNPQDLLDSLTRSLRG